MKDIYVICENDYQTLNDMCFEFGIVDILSTEEKAIERLQKHIKKCVSDYDLEVEFFDNNLKASMKSKQPDDFCQFYSCEESIEKFTVETNTNKVWLAIETNSRDIAIDSCCGEVLGAFGKKEQAIDYVVDEHLEEIKGWNYEYISNEIKGMNTTQIKEYLDTNNRLLFEEDGEEDSETFFQIVLTEVEVA